MVTKNRCTHQVRRSVFALFSWYELYYCHKGFLSNCQAACCFQNKTGHHKYTYSWTRHIYRSFWGWAPNNLPLKWLASKGPGLGVRSCDQHLVTLGPGFGWGRSALGQDCHGHQQVLRGLDVAPKLWQSKYISIQQKKATYGNQTKERCMQVTD